MLITNPKGSLRASEILFGHVVELLVDIEGFARDGALSSLETHVRNLKHAVGEAIEDIRGQLDKLDQQDLDANEPR